MALSKGEKSVKQWLKAKGWKLAAFQQDTINAYLGGKSGLLNAPTGSGKTMALFIPILIDHLNNENNGRLVGPKLRVLWITPLRALTRDLQRNMQQACDELGIGWRVGIRTGDMSAREKSLQKKELPEVLLITPESIHLLFTQKHNRDLFKNLQVVVVDEWHELLGSKRGVQTELALSRFRAIAPGARQWGISATIGNMEQALTVLTGVNFPAEKTVIIRSDKEKKVIVRSILPDEVEKLPWAGHLGINLLDKVIPVVMANKTTLLFTNTRSQTEIWYRFIAEKYPELAGLVALHHGSLDRNIRNWVEERLHEEKLKLVICTSSLDLGVDFRPVDTVIQVGSPKSISRFLQRAGRSGHSPGATSVIWFVPTHALELIEAVSLREGVAQKVLEDRVPFVQSFDVLAQYMVSLSVGDGFKEEELYEEIRSCFCYQFINREEWEWLLGYITTGGATLMAYDEFKKVEREGDLYIVKDRRTAMRHRLGMGTIVSDASVKIQYLSGKYLGSVEEGFVSRMKPGDVFFFAGMNLEFIRLREMTLQVRKTTSGKGQIPRWAGGRVPLSSQLSAFIRERLDDVQESRKKDPEIARLAPVLQLQAEISAVPHHDELLVEQCRSREGYHIFIYPFEGRLVHEGMASLIGYRISRITPVTFSIAMNDYGFELLSDKEIILNDLLEEHELFSEENLLEDITHSINATEMARRKFREIASIAGMVFQGYPGRAVRTKHLQASSSLLFDIISEHDKGNLLLRQAYQESLDQQLEEQRMRKALRRIAGQKFIFKYTDRFTPFAFPIMVDRLREQLSSEKLEDRVARMMNEITKD